ncbi:ABC transporter substrate-binding protein [Marinomonas posidonica]|uniref:Extracellular solute-binding protein family 1 n=1 Tax=Marinomonas posidonica (strain CECT 7376 / NCIMB 14433 / IVIA-Po-181) TaxID=491952 RepID=F6CXW2_MARPP|nr:extracellular solute-binding protein [Marinomonas posidonica]AEF54524.1 extracellular solute-binding protein family 1 [Marinomonas posidonica IVIA-Po-181]
MKLPVWWLVGLSFFSDVLMAAPQEISLWRHMSSETVVRNSLAAIQRFNDSQNKWRVVPDLIPEASYTLSIRAAAQAELLPCIIAIDQPLVPNFAWRGFLHPLDGLLDDKVLASLNTTGKGVYNGRVYSVGGAEVALALFTTKSLLEKISVRYPTIDRPWNKTEFMAVLDAVKATGDYQYPLDMRAQDVTEWIPYAWAPLMLSWGADLIDRSDFMTVEGVLNSPEAIQFGLWIQSLVQDKYINAYPQNDNGFVNGDIGIQYGGSWSLTSYYNRFKEDLAVLPVPDFGHGARIGGGSWHWAMTESCSYPEAAKDLLTFLMTAEEQAAVSKVIGIFPTNANALELTDSYSEEGRWRMLFDFSKRFSILRPETPAYAVISSSYKKAISDILNDMPPKLAFDIAVENIKVAFERNQNYGAR